MAERYTSHRIPKQNSKGFRIIHEFNDIDKHTNALKTLRKHCIDNPLCTKENRKISLVSSVHGYPYGNKNMIKLSRLFLSRAQTKDKFIISSFDLSNFYHFITPDKINNSIPDHITEYLKLAFVNIGNGVEVLAQGSPLSQDISNICLLPIDLKCLSVIKSFNTWTKKCKTHKIDYNSISLPTDYSIMDRQDIPMTKRSNSSFINSLAEDQNLANDFNKIYEDNPEITECVTASYMRYVDNIFISVSANSLVSNKILDLLSKALTKRIKGLFIQGTYKINNLKNKTATSVSNRKIPMLGLNLSDRVKCSRHYLNGIRAGLWGFVSGKNSDIPQSLASSAIYALYVDPKSHNRLRKCTNEIRKMDLRDSPNARTLLAFIEKENGITGEIPMLF